MALVDGATVVAVGLDTGQWDSLVKALRRKTTSATFKGCKHDAFGRISHLGTKHFVHRRNASCSYNHKPVSPAHQRIQELAFLACQAAGWAATVEHPLGGREADVAAWNGQRRIVIEVQLSSEDQTELRARTADYAAFGFETLWLVPVDSTLRTLPLAIAGVTLAGTTCTVAVPSLEFDVGAFIPKWLNGEILYAHRAKVVHSLCRQMRILATVCEACKRPNIYSQWDCERSVKSTCVPTTSMRLISGDLSTGQRPEDEGVLHAVIGTGGVAQPAILADAQYFPLKPYPLQPFFSCRNCQADLQYPGAVATRLAAGPTETVSADAWTESPHWCIRAMCASTASPV